MTEQTTMPLTELQIAADLLTDHGFDALAASLRHAASSFDHLVPSDWITAAVSVVRKLEAFCETDADSFGRYSLIRPFVQSGRLHASDGRILISLPAPGVDDSVPPEGRSFPDVSGKEFTGPFNAFGLGTFNAVPDWHPLPAHDTTCIQCNGTGVRTKVYDPDENTMSDDWCLCWQMIGNRQIGTRYAALMHTLPNVEWGVADSDPNQIVWFRFDHGGRGAIMPLDPDVTKGRSVPTPTTEGE